MKTMTRSAFLATVLGKERAVSLPTGTPATALDEARLFMASGASL